LSENQQRGDRRRPRDERHSERHYSKRFARIAVASAQIQQLAHRDPEQNQTTRHLKIRDRDPERAKDYLSEKNETDRNGEACDQAERAFVLAAFGIRVAAEPEENCDEPDGIDGDKKRDKREQEFFDERLHILLQFFIA